MTRRLALSVLIVLMLAACGPAVLTATPTAGSTPTRPPSNTPAPSANLGIPEEALQGVSVQVWMPWFGNDASLFVSQVNEFNQTNPWGITVEAVSQSNYTELYNDVTAALPTANKPQVAVAFPEHARQWDPSGQVVDLTRYVNDPKYGLTEEQVKDIAPVFWSQDVSGEKRLGVPAERTARLLIYNTSWARELGFTGPPKDPSEFSQQACKAHQAMLTDTNRKNDGMGGWLVDTSATTFLSWMEAFGGGVFEGTSFHFLTPKNLTALSYIKQLYDQGCAWSAREGADLPAAFANRQALFATASMEELSDYSRALASAGSTDEWTVLPFPGYSQSSFIVYGSSYVIFKSSAEQQLASWLFVRWLLSPENQKKWVEVEGMFPLRSSSLELLGDYEKTHPQWAAAVALLPDAHMEPQLASWRKLRIMIGDGFKAMFQSNTPVGRVAEILAIMDNTARDLTK